jgi:GT2 family glycosyltransferase
MVQRFAAPEPSAPRSHRDAATLPVEPMTDTQLTVLIASRNGARVLPRVLAGYRIAAAPSVGWKILVVDNASTDATRQVLDAFKRDLPLEVLSEPVAGKSRALNTGLRAVEGRLVVLSDDDAIPSPSFLTGWATFLQREPDFELFGGTIEPLFDGHVPRWLLDSRARFGMMFVERDLPEGPTGPGDIWGPNWAVRAAVFERGYRFNEALGPDDTDHYPMGEESEFCRRVARDGARCWFARAPQVRHIVKPELLTAAGWAKRAYRLGRGRAHQMWDDGRLGPQPTPTWWQQAQARATIGLQRLKTLSPRPRQRFENVIEYHVARGFRDECARRERKLRTAGAQAADIPR